MQIVLSHQLPAASDTVPFIGQCDCLCLQTTFLYLHTPACCHHCHCLCGMCGTIVGWLRWTDQT